MTNYVCAELAPMQNGYVACKNWVIIESSKPIIPDLTAQQWDALAVAFLLVIVFAWGIRQIGNLI